MNRVEMNLIITKTGFPQGIEEYFKRMEFPHDFQCRKERRLRSIRYFFGLEKSAIFVDHPFIPYVKEYLNKNRGASR